MQSSVLPVFSKQNFWYGWNQFSRPIWIWLADMLMVLSGYLFNTCWIDMLPYFFHLIKHCIPWISGMEWMRLLRTYPKTLVTCQCNVFVSLFGLLTVVINRLRPFMILILYLHLVLDHMTCRWESLGTWRPTRGLPYVPANISLHVHHILVCSAYM